ncbi:peptidase MA family metallohydrolase [Chloroflexota bacterium]
MKRTYPQKLNIILILVVVLLAMMPGYIAAQEIAIEVTGQAVDTAFRDYVAFTLNAESNAEIVDADLLYKLAGQVVTSRNQADFTPGAAIEAELIINQTEPGNYFPPGTELQYWWELTDADGNELTTEKQTLVYMDERYDWQTLDNDRLTLYWYEGSNTFAQNLFDRANASLDTLEDDLNVMIEESVKIFIYANHNDFLDAYHIGGQEWAGGAAFNEHGVVMMTVEPNQPEWGTIITTHEMTHLVIHQATDNFYTGDLTLPRWLDEGIAVYTSGEMNTRSDFNQRLNRAIDNNELFTLRTLSSPFSSDPDEAVQSYAQSGAVVNFIIDTYGPEAMAELLGALAEGALYDEALEQALSLDTDALDNAFRDSIDLPPLPDLEDEAPAEASEPAPATGSTTGESDEAVESVEPQEPAEVAEDVVEPAQDTEESVSEAPPPVEEPAGSPFGLTCCLAGFIPLLMVGLALYASRFMFAGSR